MDIVVRDGHAAQVDAALVRRLHRQAGAERWGVSADRLHAALEASVARAFSARPPDAAAVRRYLTSLHLADLALACACADGHEAAWDHFVCEQRPALYRAADALEPGGGARELADSLYAELYGLRETSGERRSLLAYYHGRSSLTTWLRAVLAQRFVDRVRARKRLEPLPDDPPDGGPQEPPPDPARAQWLGAMERALRAAIDQLPARDRLRLSCYYTQELTLAETGSLLQEHEATVSRHLARTRRAIREHVERHLREEGFTEPEIVNCFQSAIEEGRLLDLGFVSTSTGERKDSGPHRSS